jgi:hypothetical protein
VTSTTLPEGRKAQHLIEGCDDLCGRFSMMSPPGGTKLKSGDAEAVEPTISGRAFK